MEAEWPFFEPSHRDLVSRLVLWSETPPEPGTDAAQRLAALAEAGVLSYAVPEGNSLESIDCRALFAIREQLAQFDPDSDRALVALGMGAAALLLRGSAPQRAQLAAARQGTWLLVLADASGGTVTAAHDGDEIVLEGDVDTSGIDDPDAIVVFAGTGSAYLVERATRGSGGASRFTLENCRIPANSLIGAEGDGTRIAVAVRELFGVSAAAAAIGLARAILDRLADRLVDRATFGRRLLSYQAEQARLADLAVRIDAADLVTFRAAWARDHEQTRMPRESAMARLGAFDTASAALELADSILADQPDWRAAMRRQFWEIAGSYDREIEQLLLAGQTLNKLRPAIDGWRGRPRVDKAVS